MAQFGFVSASKLAATQKDAPVQSKTSENAPKKSEDLDSIHLEAPPPKRAKIETSAASTSNQQEVIDIDDDEDVEQGDGPKTPLKQWNWRESGRKVIKSPSHAPVIPPTSIPMKPSSSSVEITKQAPAAATGPQKPRQAALVLADRLRPTSLDEYVGHDHLVKQGNLLRTLIDNDTIPSCIFWGPPGSGKTSLANVIAHQTKCHFVKISAVSAGVAQVKEVVADAVERKKYRQHTLLFIDEIHRFNKLQQDALLPHVESGTITLIGATTENPSFECNAALLSRCRVFVLQKLTVDDLRPLLRRGVQELAAVYPHRLNPETQAPIEIEDDAIELLGGLSDGDARQALNALEMAFLATAPEKITTLAIQTAFQRTHLLYDKTGEEHYSIISALHKSMRGSDVQASLYWMARMLEGGEDPTYVARRLIRFASEDVGLADPNALTQAVSGFQAVQFIGMPECNVILAQVTAYLARAPKSNKLYEAYNAIQADIKNKPLYPVPLHLRNAPTKMMADLGFSKGYKYNPDHGYEGEIQDYLPPELKGSKWFQDDVTARTINKGSGDAIN
eukprot:TRINITY_DN3174_c0_g2_i1.p1 TRINITY_DN3174_c0_g2~~TRINITY_DN3174_c0_g2_i1.p1  ORF type:complete len:577 (-),score=98.78 TRINITY_DN3174_c0_g2_i1:377-2062(-)